MVGKTDFSPDDLSYFENTAETFVQEYEQPCFGKRRAYLKACTIQIHSLLHIASNIRDLASPILFTMVSGTFPSHNQELVHFDESRVQQPWNFKITYTGRWTIQIKNPTATATLHHRRSLDGRMAQCLDKRWQRKISPTRRDVPHDECTDRLHPNPMWSRAALPQRRTERPPMGGSPP
jgi:hypothetical protein